MKIEFEVDESKILELAKSTSADELPRSIYYEAKREAVEIATREIKAKLAEKSYYSNKESLYQEVSDYLYKSLEEAIKKFVENRLSEKNIESMVDRLVERHLQNWIETKVNERLEAIKADLQFYSNSELKEEHEQMEADYNNR